jgi:hypothetical protein
MTIFLAGSTINGKNDKTEWTSRSGHTKTKVSIGIRFRK